jgi:hypothetical protein
MIDQWWQKPSRDRASRTNRKVHARICERLGSDSTRPTRHSRLANSAAKTAAIPGHCRPELRAITRPLHCRKYKSYRITLVSPHN